MSKAHILFIAVDISIPYAQSLKDKRQPLKSLKQKLANKYNISIAEIDHHDDWQRSVLGVVMINSDKRYLEKQSSLIEQSILETRDVELIGFDREFV